MTNLVKSWSKMTNLIKLVKSWSSWSKYHQLGEVGQELVKLVRNWPTWSSWSKVGQVGQKWPTWWSRSRVGQVGQKLTNLVMLVKNWSSCSKVGQVGQKLVKFGKNVNLNWSSHVWNQAGQCDQSNRGWDESGPRVTPGGKHPHFCSAPLHKKYVNVHSPQVMMPKNSAIQSFLCFRN